MITSSGESGRSSKTLVVSLANTRRVPCGDGGVSLEQAVVAGVAGV
ncbi:MAG: hypothetical protein U9N43_01690 [Euryarchaeota archaeon]|nr:hypothetical protein [Euryarchaeota archaeon]